MGKRRRRNNSGKPGPRRSLLGRVAPSRAGPKLIGGRCPPYIWAPAVVVAVVVAAAIWWAVPTLHLGALLWPHRAGWPDPLTRGSAAGFNALLISLDTTRADRLGCYGYAEAETPVLDALAAEGIRFDDAVTVVPVTLPSHATIFTGLDPPNHGVRNNGEYRLGADHDTLAEVLRNAGYETAAFVSAFVLDARFGLDQGFDLYDDNVEVATSATVAAFAKPIYERSAGRVTSAAIRWLMGRDRNRPFFCWVHYFDPHSPYQPPPPFAGRFRSRPYDGEIAYMDSQIGRLLRALETNGLRDDTLVIVVADHGESLGEHGEATHAKLVYESVMRVPLILSCPSLFRGPYVVDDVVSIADIFPTVLDLLDIENTRSNNGKSAVPRILSRHLSQDREGILGPADSATRRMIYLETLAPYLDNGWSPLYGVRRHHDKYILAPRPEYYDLSSDPNELNNLYGKVEGAGKTARDMLVAALSSRLAKQAPLETVAASAQPLDPEAVRRLESLGYVGSLSGTDADGELPDPKDMMPVLRALDRVDALASAGRHEQALAVLKEAAALSPRDRRVLLTMGKLYLHMERTKEAEEAFRAYIAISPSARVCILLAQIMLADGRLDEAAELLDQAETLDRRHGGIYLARGDLFALRGLPKEAIAAYEHAQEVDPYRATAEARARIKRLQEILETLKQ